jgi:hypothetical protein
MVLCLKIFGVFFEFIALVFYIQFRIVVFQTILPTNCQRSTKYLASYSKCITTVACEIIGGDARFWFFFFFNFDYFMFLQFTGVLVLFCIPILLLLQFACSCHRSSSQKKTSITNRQYTRV